MERSPTNLPSKLSSEILVSKAVEKTAYFPDSVLCN